MKRLGVVTCRAILPHARSEENPLYTTDDLHFVRALASRGWEAVPLVWGEPLPTEFTLDAVVVRSPWDYQEDMSTFLEWLEAIEAQGIPVANDVDTIRWNIDKRYLLELEEKGLPSIPTRLLLPEEPAPTLRELLLSEGWEQAIVKPVVGAGAKNNFKVSLGEAEEFERETFAGLREREAFLVQPFVEEVVSEGEWSLVFFGDQYSHSLLKKAKPGDYRVQDDHGGTVHHEEAPARLVSQAKDVLRLLDRPLLYARIDGVEVKGDFQLIEAELIEPELFLRVRDDAGENMVDALEEWLANRNLPC